MSCYPNGAWAKERRGSVFNVCMQYLDAYSVWAFDIQNLERSETPKIKAPELLTALCRGPAGGAAVGAPARAAGEPAHCRGGGRGRAAGRAGAHGGGGWRRRARDGEHPRGAAQHRLTSVKHFWYRATRWKSVRVPAKQGVKMVCRLG